MKRTVLLIAAAAALLMSCGGFYMVEEKTKPEIKASPDQATLVIYRGTSFGFAVKIDNFLDNKFIGQTKGKCFFITRVAPGEHYVIAAAENNACVKVNFQPGKVYYLLQAIYPGVMFARTGYNAATPEGFQKDLPDLSYYVPVSAGDLPTMDEETYKKTIADHEEELQKEPERHKDTMNMQGY